MSDELVQFLRARLDEDERIARAADPGLTNLTGWVEIQYDETKADEAHALRHNPARVLAEVEAKREIIRWHLHDECCSVCLDDVQGCPLFRTLALPYADHPAYRADWRP